MVVVDRLDERLDLAALGHLLGSHAARDLAGVPLDAGHEGEAEGVGLGAVVEGLDDNDLNSGGSNQRFVLFCGVARGFFFFFFSLEDRGCVGV